MTTRLYDGTYNSATLKAITEGYLDRKCITDAQATAALTGENLFIAETDAISAIIRAQKNGEVNDLINRALYYAHRPLTKDRGRQAVICAMIARAQQLKGWDSSPIFAYSLGLASAIEPGERAFVYNDIAWIKL